MLELYPHTEEKSLCFYCSFQSESDPTPPTEFISQSEHWCLKSFFSLAAKSAHVLEGKRQILSKTMANEINIFILWTKLHKYLIDTLNVSSPLKSSICLIEQQYVGHTLLMCVFYVWYRATVNALLHVFGGPQYCIIILCLMKCNQDWFRKITFLFLLIWQFVCVESLVTAVVDMYPETFRRGYRRELLILGMSVVSFFIGLIMCTEVRLSHVYIDGKTNDSSFKM